MSGELRKELEGLDLGSASSGKYRPLERGVTEAMIDDFCKIVYRAMIVTAEGYLHPSDIAVNTFDDMGIDPFRKAIDLGFTSFVAFLHSNYMKKYIEIDLSNDIISYHAIITPELLKTIGHIQREQRTAFLEMTRRPFPTRRYNALNGRMDITPQQFLKERMKKRECQERTEAGGKPEKPPDNEEEEEEEEGTSSMFARQNFMSDDEVFEEIGEDEQFKLADIKWRLDENVEDDSLIFCESKGN
ncbi:hypothetical protein GPALN_007935 [Globodera pallida]|nr:hypothetical protein GPALN_007935 [Globodera pallida]